VRACNTILSRQLAMKSTTRLFCLALLSFGLFVNASASAAQQPSRPNILFIIFDDWNGSTHAGAYGCTWIKTPNFDRIAREGVLFKNAFTSNPKCSPCRASILTGRHTWQLKEAVSHNALFPSGFEVYPDLLEPSCYLFLLTGKSRCPRAFHNLLKRSRKPARP